MRGREDLQHVQLLHRSAIELADLPAASFDTVVLNSVVQYFPDIDYLVNVLQQVVRLVSPGGNIFLGDIRNLDSLMVFHSAVQLGKAAAAVSIGQLRGRISRAIAQEKELVIEPRFFHALHRRIPGLGAVEVKLKRGRASNELTRYRYDVILHARESVDAPEYERLSWQETLGTLAGFEAALREHRWSAVHLSSIPDARLARDMAAHRLIEASDERLDVGTLRRKLNEMQVSGIDPHELWTCAEKHGYRVTLTVGARGCFDVQLSDGSRRSPPSTMFRHRAS
jgi:SAM-dependent methyltransferase